MRGKPLQREIPAAVTQLLALNHLPHVAALADSIGREHTKTHIYRILAGETKHQTLITLLKLSRAFGLVNADGQYDIDLVARYLLDCSKQQSKTWLREQMIKSEITSVRRLAIRAGLTLRAAQEIESGEQQYIQLRIYRDIARGLKISLCKLLEILFDGKPESELLQSRPEVANVTQVRFSGI